MAPRKQKTSKTTCKKRSTKRNVSAPVTSVSLRCEEVSSTIDDTLLEDAVDDTLLEDVLKKNGEQNLQKKILKLARREDDPPVIFGWQNVEAFVRAIQTARAQAAAPGGVPLPADPLGLPAAFTVQDFKEALLDHATVPGAAGRLDTTCLPCSSGQSLQVAFTISGLDFDPWIRRIVAVGMPNILPIAFVYVPRPRTHTLERATVPTPGSLWG
jgi:hypothetical protein